MINFDSHLCQSSRYEREHTHFNSAYRNKTGVSCDELLVCPRYVVPRILPPCFRSRLWGKAKLEPSPNLWLHRNISQAVTMGGGGGGGERRSHDVFRISQLEGVKASIFHDPLQKKQAVSVHGSPENNRCVDHYDGGCRPRCGIAVQAKGSVSVTLPVHDAWSRPRMWYVLVMHIKLLLY